MLGRWACVCMMVVVFGSVAAKRVRSAEEGTASVEELKAQVAQLEARVAELETAVAKAEEEAKEVRKRNGGLLLEVRRLGRLCREAGVQTEEKKQPAPRPPAQEDSTSPDKSPWDGFRGLKWGQQLDQCKGMGLWLSDKDSPLLSKSDSRLYHRGEQMSIGNAKLTRVLYGFYRGKFYRYVVITSGYSNFTALKLAVEARYGRGKQENETIDEWRWTGNTSSGQMIVMTLEYNEFDEEALWYALHVPTLQQERRDEEEAAKEAGEDF